MTEAPETAPKKVYPYYWAEIEVGSGMVYGNILSYRHTIYKKKHWFSKKETMFKGDWNKSAEYVKTKAQNYVNEYNDKSIAARNDKKAPKLRIDYIPKGDKRREEY